MQTRTLGRTGLEVSLLGYGAMELRGPPRSPDLSDAQAGQLLNTLLDAGVTLIDTSISYGRSEELIGRHLGHRRDEYVLASKCGCIPSSPMEHDFRRHNIRIGTEQSLRRLATDHLDLLQVHASPSRSQLEIDGTVQTLLELRDEGKVRWIGMSGTLPHLPDHIEMGVFDVFQIPFSALQREHEELIGLAADTGAGTLIRGGAARGAPADDKAWSVGPIGLPDGEAARRWSHSEIETLLDGMDPFEFVLRFSFNNPAVSSVIVGTSNIDHLRSNLAIAERGSLPSDLYDVARRRLATATAP
jgi:aryl-alcohol dehydrogenase-like predicted oxidoreductase